MTDFDAHATPHRRNDPLPPYAPRPAADPPAAAQPPEPVAAAPTLSPEAAEEADAFAEARAQGVDETAWPPPQDDAAGWPPPGDDVTPSVPATEVLLTSGAEADPATAELMVVGAPGRSAAALGTADAVSGTGAASAGSSQGASTTAAPVIEPEAAAELGRRRERSRRASTRRAASALAAERRPRFRDDPIRGVLLGLGELLITAGVILGLFVVYELWVTDLLGGQKQEAVSQQMEQRWSSSSAAPSSAPTSSSDVVAPPPADAQVVDPAERQRKYTTVTGEGFANIYIPVFGADYVYAVVEGTTIEDLYGNPGHYDDTQYPGEVGNFAVAGHRVSKGSPFNALDTLNACDAIVIETQDEWFVYRVLPMEDEAAAWNPAARPQCAGVVPLTGEYAGVPGREIVDPSDYAQVLPVPHIDAVGPDALAAADQRLITLTTCHPQFSDAQRMIIHGVLTKTYAKAPGFLPPELAET